MRSAPRDPSPVDEIGMSTLSGQDPDFVAPASPFLAGLASLASSGFSKMITCCQGRNSSDSLKVNPWGSTLSLIFYYH